MGNIKFYKCPICGNVIELLDGNINHIRCCGVEMDELIANTVDAAVEKHVPVYEIANNKICVRVGDVIHPMEDKHFIMWILLASDNRIERIDLKPGDSLEVEFPYVENSSIYAYCNLHGLWKNDVK